MCPRKSLAENKCLLLDGYNLDVKIHVWGEILDVPGGITWRMMRVEVWVEPTSKLPYLAWALGL